MSDFKLIRWLLGGTWYFYKMGRDTPNIGMFSAWLRDPPSKIDMDFCRLLSKEKYENKRWRWWLSKT